MADSIHIYPIVITKPIKRVIQYIPRIQTDSITIDKKAFFEIDGNKESDYPSYTYHIRKEDIEAILEILKQYVQKIS